MNLEILHDEKERQFYVLFEGNRAYVAYEILDNGIFDLQHTIVPKPISGKGIAALLVKNACDYAQSHGLKIRATCAYAQAWLERHSDYDYELGNCGSFCSL